MNTTIEETLPKNFSDITSADQLFLFLNTKRHRYYHHFTTIDTLKKILSTRKWRLFTGHRMNDLHEYYDKNSFLIRQRLFTSCFSCGDEDNMAMWAMYAIPWEHGVRISIPINTMKSWFSYLQKKEWNCSGEIETITLHDIVYYDGFVDSDNAHLLWHRGKCKAMQDNQRDIARSDRFTGYVKNSAWKHEEEARISLLLKENISQDYFDIPIPDKVIKNFEICLSPMCSKNTDAVCKEISSALDMMSLEKKPKEDFFADKVFFKKHCDFCSNTFYRGN